MAARGSVSKEVIIKKIMEIFPEAFLVNGKELRIPMNEETGEVQIKVGLTAAKDNIPHEGGSEPTMETPVTSSPAMTDEEIQETRELMRRLNL